LLHSSRQVPTAAADRAKPIGEPADDPEPRYASRRSSRVSSLFNKGEARMQQSFRSLLTGLALIGVVSTPALAQTVTTVALLNGADVPTRSVFTCAASAAQVPLGLGTREVYHALVRF